MFTAGRLKEIVANSRLGPAVRRQRGRTRRFANDYPLLVPVAELAAAHKRALAEQSSRVDGPITYFEAGVFAGRSLATWHSTTSELQIPTRMFAADSYQGLPKGVELDDGGWREGDYACSLASTKKNLRRLGAPVDDINFIKGWFDESLTPDVADQVGRVHVAMLDADAYSSTVPVLEFLTPLLDDVTWIIFDDWFTGGNFDQDTGLGRGLGVERAFREWQDRNSGWLVSEEATYDLTREGRTFKAGMVLRMERSEYQ